MATDPLGQRHRRATISKEFAGENVPQACGITEATQPLFDRLKITAVHRQSCDGVKSR